MMISSPRFRRLIISYPGISVPPSKPPVTWTNRQLFPGNLTNIFHTDFSLEHVKFAGESLRRRSN